MIEVLAKVNRQIKERIATNWTKDPKSMNLYEKLSLKVDMLFVYIWCKVLLFAYRKDLE